MKLFIVALLAFASVASAQSNWGNLIRLDDNGFTYTCPVSGNQMRVDRSGTVDLNINGVGSLHVGPDAISATDAEGNVRSWDLPEEQRRAISNAVGQVAQRVESVVRAIRRIPEALGRRPRWNVPSLGGENGNGIAGSLGLGNNNQGWGLGNNQGWGLGRGRNNNAGASLGVTVE